MGVEEEQKLVEQAKTDQQAFGKLFDLYYTPIVNYVLHRVGDVATAEDLTSVVFFKAWHGLPKFEWRSVPFRAWLYRIASNEVNSYFRQKKTKPSSLEALFDETGFEFPSTIDIEADYMEYEDALQKHKDFQLVHKLVLCLPLKYQEVLVLRYFEKKSLLDIAELTGKKINTVKSLLARGTTKLHKSFTSHKRLHP